MANGTFSVLAHDPVTGELGGAVQSRVCSAGDDALRAEAGIDVVATQAVRDDAEPIKELRRLAERGGGTATDFTDAAVALARRGSALRLTVSRSPRGSLMRSSRFGSRAFAHVAAVALTATLAQPTAALAQFGSGGGAGSAEPMIRVGFGGGVTVPVSDARNLFQNGMNGVGFVLVNLFGAGLPALRFAFTYDRFGFKSNAANTGAGSTSTIDPGTSQIFGGTGGLKIHLVPGPVRPFVIAGIGAFDVHQALNLAAGGQSTSSKLNFGIDGGGGIEIKLGRLSAFAEGRIQNVFTPNTGFATKSSIQSIPVTFGILF